MIGQNVKTITSGLFSGSHIVKRNMASESNLFFKALSNSVRDLNVNNLQSEQQECIRRLVCCDEDVLAVLPTGFGKSLIYQLLPSVHQNLHLLETGEMKHFMVIVVSPLDYIRQQQVANVARTMCGVRAAAIGESDANDKEISEGKYNIIYGSAEQWLSSRRKKCLQYGGLHHAKVLVVDEVHTVEAWYVAYAFFSKW